MVEWLFCNQFMGVRFSHQAPTHLMPSDNENLNEMLSAYEFDVTFLDTSEFSKSGGSLQCMSLWI